VAQPVATSASGNNDSIVNHNLLASGLVCLNASYFSPPVLIKSTVHLPKSDCKKFCNHSSVALSKPSGARVLRDDTNTSQVKSTPAQMMLNPVQIALSNILPPVASTEALNSLIFSTLPSQAFRKSHNKPFVSSILPSLNNLISSTRVLPPSKISFAGSSITAFLIPVNVSVAFSINEGLLASLILADKPVACTGVSSNIPSSLNLSSLDAVFGVQKYHGVTADLSYNQYLKFPAIIVY
tara:strand:- start:811 stop:1527 length:717 start_codon:yes stop_codon:yes gene_type:complete